MAKKKPASSVAPKAGKPKGTKGTKKPEDDGSTQLLALPAPSTPTNAAPSTGLPSTPAAGTPKAATPKVETPKVRTLEVKVPSPKAKVAMKKKKDTP